MPVPSITTPCLDAPMHELLSPIRRLFQKLFYGAGGNPISFRPKPGDYGRRNLRDVGVVIVGLAPMNIRNVQLDNRSVEHLESVEDRN